MPATRRCNALTVTELLVVITGLGLLTSITLPTAQTLARRGDQAVCLANLGQIAQAAHYYAAEDPRQQLAPLHRLYVLASHTYGFSGYWSWRTALPRVFGGTTPTVSMPVWHDWITVMMNEDGPWAGPTRPLNAYIPGADPTVFHCPADTGYPEVDPPEWGGDLGLDAPNQAAGIPCRDYLGNSYRENTSGVIWIAGPLMFGKLDAGPGGHAAWAVENPGRTILCGDSLFLWWTRYIPGETPNPVELGMPGWHGQPAADNVAYCDGSGRMTEFGEFYLWTIAELEDMGFSPDFMNHPYYFLRRGPTWQTDCYPSPGAVIKTYADSGNPLWNPSMMPYTGWPFDNYTENEPPF